MSELLPTKLPDPERAGSKCGAEEESKGNSAESTDVEKN